MKLVIPLALGLVGLGGGLAAGHIMRPAPPAPEASAHAVAAPAPAAAQSAMTENMPAYDPALKRDYVKLDRQFVVPLVERDGVEALMIVSLSVEVDAGVGAEVFAREPKLRDVFLQVLFRHAQSGAFSGVFTAGPAMHDLRGSLLEAARSVLGPVAHGVLVTDILRQDL